MFDCLVKEFVNFFLLCLCGYRVCVVICLVPSCVIYYYQDVDQTGGGAPKVFQSNLGIIVNKSSLHLSSIFVGKLNGNVVVQF